MADYIDDEDDDEDEMGPELETAYRAIHPRPRPLTSTASSGGKDIEADAETYRAVLMSLNADLVLADNDATFATDNFIYNHYDIDFLADNMEAEPGYSPSSILHTQRHDWARMPSSSSAPSPPSTPTRNKLFYNLKVAEARKLTDSAVVKSILDAATSGQYHDNPKTHPAFNVQQPETTPPFLQTFHNPTAISLANLTSAHLQASAVGTAIQRLNSLPGISLLEFCELRKRTVKCLSCLCYFSLSGYQAHIEYSMHCQNTPALEPAPDLSHIFDLLPFKVDKSLPFGIMCRHEPSLSNPVGLAWVTWNSRTGITHDVWVQLITAWRRCSGGCDKVRSFRAHLDHLKDHPCSMYGDEAAGVPPMVDEEENEDENA